MESSQKKVKEDPVLKEMLRQCATETPWCDGRESGNTEEVLTRQVGATMKVFLYTFEDHLYEDMNKVERKLDQKMAQCEEEVAKIMTQMDRQLM